MRLQRRFMVAATMFLVAMPLLAQEFTGRVTDKTGSVVAKATVIVHNIDTGVSYNAITNGDGIYVVPYLNAGHYSVSAKAAGFETSVHNGITLQVGDTSVVNFVLQVGSTSETVVVTANTVLDAGKADVGEVVENTRVTQLPLNGRDPMMLSELAAGVNYSQPFGYTRPFDDTQQYTSVNGGGNGNIEMLLDGTPNNAAPINITGGSTENVAHTSYTTPVDSVQEFKMITSPYDAQYGMMSGGVEDVVLKSGTNTLHGDAYEFARRTWLDANSWENDYLIHTLKPGTDLSPYQTARMKWDQFGYELDGPIVVPKLYDGRNKSFFLMQWEHFAQQAPLTDIASVPDPAWANGDFSNLDYWTPSGYLPKAIYDPLTAVFDTTPGSPTQNDWVRQPFPGNIIPPGRIDPMAQKILKLFPAPNIAVTGGRDHWNQNYALSTHGNDKYNNILLKWDENWSNADRFSLRYGYWMRNTNYNGNGMPAPLTTGEFPIVARSHTFALDETHTFSPTLLVDFNANVSVRADLNRGGSFYDSTALGWTQGEVDSMGGGARGDFPQLCWGDQWWACYANDYTGVGNTGNVEAIKNSLNLLPTVTWIKGKHSVRAGLDARFWQNGYSQQAGGPTITTGIYWSGMTANHAYYRPDDGNDFASFLMGNPTSASNQIWPLTFQSQHYWAPFVQDDWKVSSKLTLNLGLRWDFMPAEVERHNQGNYAFDTTDINPYLTSVRVPGHGELVGGLTFLGVNGNPTSDYKLVKGDYQPRVGFAYALNTKTVIRGGFGKSMQAAQNGIPVAGYSSTTTAITSNPNYPSGALPNTQNPLISLFWGGPSSGIVQPTGSSMGLGTNLGQNGYGVTTINPFYRNPSFWSYSLGFERQFFTNDSINVSYVGSRLYDGNSSSNINLQNNAMKVACNPMLGGIPDNCNTQNAQANLPNPFYGVSVMPSNYSAPTVFDKLDLSRPMPQFGDTTVNEMNDARTWFNSLQITVLHKVSNSLTLHGTETWSKSMDAGTWADQGYGIRNRTVDTNDMPHRVTVSGVYMLPIGRGHMFLPNANRIVDSTIGGWEVSSLFIWQSGVPEGVPGYYLHNARVSRHLQKDNGYIRVFAPFAEHYEEKNGLWFVGQYENEITGPGGTTGYDYDGPNTGTPNFMDVPPYAPAAMVEYSGIREAGVRTFDTSFDKNFSLHENLMMQLRLDAFNVLNHPEWTGGADTTTTDPNLGVITKGPTGQSNNPRQMQISVKVSW
ncbi:MAG: carboxypeptidase regulatory-like domain-containing protein [Acidobacteriota bacterium]